MHEDGRLEEGQIGMVIPEEQQAWDDTIGAQLEWGMVQEARKEEMGEIRKHTVYKIVQTQEAWDVTGKAQYKSDGLT